MIAKFSFWKDKALELSDVQGLIVLTPPSQSDGRDEIYVPVWQEFAKKNKLGLVGCFFRDDIPEGFVEDYCNVRVSGSGLALIHFTQELFPRMGVPRMLLWGFSAGGQFNYEFACCYPHLVAGFVVNKGGIYYTLLAPGETRQIPALFIIGRRDAKFRQASLDAITSVNSVAGCRWEVMDEDVSHVMGKSMYAGVAFFKDVLKGGL